MISMPTLRSPASRRKSIWNFSGLDRRPVAVEGAVRSGKNLSAAALPCLTARSPRENIAAYAHATDLIAAQGALTVIDGTNFIYDGIIRGQVTAGTHQMAVMGAKIVVFPEKAFYDIDSQVFGSLEIQISGKATFTTNTVTLTGASAFSVNDGVTISGCADIAKNKTCIVRAVAGNTLTFDAGCFTAGTENTATLTRAVPALDFVLEKDNRLWGTVGNKICCSALGDPGNWMVFEGLASDSWETTVGTDGAFTGISALGSHLVFLKEHCIHKLYGTKPSNFQVQISQLPGVLAGCPHGILQVEERLYWWSRKGLVGYGGAAVEWLSEPLGDGTYTAAALGAQGHLLYVSVLRDGVPELLTLDLEQGVWMPQDDTYFHAFACLDRLYGLTDTGLYALNEGTESFSWQVELGPFDLEDGESNLFHRLSVLAEYQKSGLFVAELAFDDAQYRRVVERRITRPGRISLPLRLQRCRRFRLRLTLDNSATLRNIALFGQKGSGVAWLT